MLEGIIFDSKVFILVDSGASESYISSFLLHSLPTKAKPLKESWKVEFTFEQKSQVIEFLENVTLNLPNF